MFGLGTGELVVIFMGVFLLFGATRLPELGRGLGHGIRSFRDALKSAEDNPEEKKDPPPK